MSVCVRACVAGRAPGWTGVRPGSRSRRAGAGAPRAAGRGGGTEAEAAAARRVRARARVWPSFALHTPLDKTLKNVAYSPTGDSTLSSTTVVKFVRAMAKSHASAAETSILLHQIY